MPIYDAGRQQVKPRVYNNLPVFVADVLGIDIPEDLDGRQRQRWAEDRLGELPPFRTESGFYWVG